VAVTEDQVRAAALALPSVTDTSWGFRVNGTLFAAISTRYEERALLLWVKDLDEKEAMLESRPDLFFTKPHYDGHASVLARLSALTESELADLLAAAHRLRAAPPKRSRRSRAATR
jgi:hypothetical protein